ncbi:maleylpyruvate isomerase family mycothiol-dependent enzyme [Streptosporangium sp. KLBMP 9127]|nr:maleylpyruvate isomerase family mycothiol-dependent enzyme [Streptosporangium sp. KLBMP 9127]
MTPTELVSHVHTGHRRLEGLLADLTDDDIRAPSALPGWTRGHLVTHLANLAHAFTRQAEYAHQGRLIEVYDGGRPGRDAAIERGAGRTAAELREATTTAHATLEKAWAATGDDGWALPVSYRDGELLDTVVTRRREVEIHLADLDLGYLPSNWPVEFCEHTATFLAPRVPDGIRLTLSATDTTWNWTSGTGEPVVVRGPAGDLTAWLAGRSTGGRVTAENGDLPQLDPWP